MSEVQIKSEETTAIAPKTDEHGNQLDDKGQIIKPNPMDVDPITGQVVNKDNPASDKEKPDWCPDKFWDKETGQVNQEGLAKSYSELEKKQGTPPKGDPQNSGDADPQKAVSEAGLNFDDLATEYAEKGELSEDSYKALEAGGISKAVVDQYIKGQESIATSQINEMKGLIGGEKNYEEMSGWASASLTDAEIEAFNDNVNSGNPERVKLAVQGLYAEFQKANGRDPSLNFGDTGALPGGSSFKSWAEVTTAMKDERYSKDPAYRQDVENKIARSTLD